MQENCLGNCTLLNHHLTLSNICCPLGSQQSFLKEDMSFKNPYTSLWRTQLSFRGKTRRDGASNSLCRSTVPLSLVLTASPCMLLIKEFSQHTDRLAKKLQCSFKIDSLVLFSYSQLYQFSSQISVALQDALMQAPQLVLLRQMAFHFCRSIQIRKPEMDIKCIFPKHNRILLIFMPVEQLRNLVYD